MVRKLNAKLNKVKELTAEQVDIKASWGGVVVDLQLEQYKALSKKLVEEAFPEAKKVQMSDRTSIEPLDWLALAALRHSAGDKSEPEKSAATRASQAAGMKDLGSMLAKAIGYTPSVAAMRRRGIDNGWEEISETEWDEKVIALANTSTGVLTLFVHWRSQTEDATQMVKTMKEVGAKHQIVLVSVVYAEKVVNKTNGQATDDAALTTWLSAYEGTYPACVVWTWGEYFRLGCDLLRQVTDEAFAVSLDDVEEKTEYRDGESPLRYKHVFEVERHKERLELVKELAFQEATQCTER